MIKKTLLNLGIEFGPIIVFFFASEITNFFRATALFVIATILSLIASYVERKTLAWFPLIVGIIVIGAGSLTLIFHNPIFLILKDTLYNGIFAIVLFIGLYFDKGLLKPLFKEIFAMTDKGWRILSFRWAIMFSILAIVNEIVRMHYPPHVWVIYKGCATLATSTFSLYQFRLSKQERLSEASAWGMRK